jgi:hypothetical protein
MISDTVVLAGQKEMILDSLFNNAGGLSVVSARAHSLIAEAWLPITHLVEGKGFDLAHPLFCRNLRVTTGESDSECCGTGP